MGWYPFYVRWHQFKFEHNLLPSLSGQCLPFNLFHFFLQVIWVISQSGWCPSQLAPGSKWLSLQLCTLFSRFRKQTKYAVTVSSCQMAHHLPPLSHTILFTQPSQKITFFRIFYFNHYLLIKNLLRSSVSFWGKLAKLPFFLLIRSSHITQSFINSLIIQVLRGSKYNERKTVFYMNYPSVRDGRAVRTYLPFPSGE